MTLEHSTMETGQYGYKKNLYYIKILSGQVQIVTSQYPVYR